MSASNAGRVGVWGASGSGKSSYVKQRIKTARRLVVFDPLEEYNARHVHSLDQVRREMAASFGAFRLALVPRSGSEADTLSMLCRLLMRAQQPFKEGRLTAPLTLVVEEMNMSFPVAGGAARSPGFAEICSRGRHFGIEVIGVSQRIAEVDTRFRGNCTETVVFRQKGARDRQAAAAELGCHVRELPGENLEYIHEQAGRLVKGKITFPKAANSNRKPQRKRKAA